MLLLNNNAGFRPKSFRIIQMAAIKKGRVAPFNLIFYTGFMLPASCFRAYVYFHPNGFFVNECAEV